MQNGTLVLNKRQIDQKIDRIAYQIYEDNVNESEVILAGSLSSGFTVAKMIAEAIQKISRIRVTLVSVSINKHSHHEEQVTLSVPVSELKDKTIIVVDDVLNSGKTMMYALRPFLSADIKKLRTVVLVDRNHKRYPVAADFTGLSLATTLQEHVSVVLGETGEGVYLS